MEIGSSAHRDLFCRSFLEGHRRYDAPDLPWPELDEGALALLRGLPFWTHARQFEKDAGPMITAVAAQEADPLVREALQLQAFEENRHARLVDFMIERYSLPADPSQEPIYADPVAEFVDFGFEECLDSFGAFGLFALARRSELLPDALFEIFDNVMREESHHIVFFINWFAHREARRGRVARALRGPRSLWHYAKALRKIAELVRDDGSGEGADFIVTGAQAFLDDLTPRLVLRTCLAENARRMADFDRRLIMPALIPRLARLAAAGLRLIPSRGAAAGAVDGAGARESGERTPHAA
jgi:hypothetical protein